MINREKEEWNALNFTTSWQGKVIYKTLRYICDNTLNNNPKKILTVVRIIEIVMRYRKPEILSSFIKPVNGWR